jgi:hypothetical protein
MVWALGVSIISLPRNAGLEQHGGAKNLTEKLKTDPRTHRLRESQ